MISGKRLKLLFALVDRYVKDDKVRKIMKKSIMEIVYLPKGQENVEKPNDVLDTTPKKVVAALAPVSSEEEVRRLMSSVTI